ncbi:hypothetical protein BY458DRAFT_176408 [Sporodiniella umbellata]|nr:hypothetical protein BY458DRAFT_176408 [Sporodiniella umbellata]
MVWLEGHPVLCHHDLVLSFVRSSCWNPSVVRDLSLSRKQLLEEKMEHFSCSMNSIEEKYFFSYIQDTIRPLQESCLKVLVAGRQLDSIRQDLQMKQLEITIDLKTITEPSLFDIIKVCANATCSYFVRRVGDTRRG